MVKELLENFNPQDYPLWLFLLAIGISFLVSSFSYPAIINVAKSKNLLDTPGGRSSHSGSVPNLGGIGMFLSIVVTITLTGAVLDTKILLLILGGVTFLFFLGLKDDILILSPRKKFTGQLLAILLLIVFTDTRIVSFSDIFGIGLMPYWLSVIFTMFVYVLIINAFNLIDGIDGLAGSLALMAVLSFAYVFYRYKDMSMVVLAAAVIGALLPFLYLNFSRSKKMFMGDTGSMILGFIIAVFAVRFINKSELSTTAIYHNASPVLVLAFLFFPLLDTLRIFFIRRFILKTSPFAADKNHLHHRFLDLGFSHWQTTSIIVCINIILIVLIYFFKDFNINLQLALLLGAGTILYSLYFIYNWLKKMKKV
ncbi:glycosyltransferase family 4 protein [Winogradskyella sediminis]|uniref:UDP-N-acetylmuramyl pentapeptide phosphotransferase/UDP-N-acetylglucosamine-1-phosphate transferase n=1 Tax=Winogradskyella sediminis TaxID=1382466 RepID=A0A1H1PSQ4_9FLAO|nr:MraY family glycosyltransferase [Winogradskyella sediminis]SDS14381.1 UDP-N-acetylmuramyl pentapeptide phosphotransferase/UDP-N-acetylglucosamine-1-phosphate transferase [Winogradskyella sediminis]